MEVPCTIEVTPSSSVVHSNMEVEETSTDQCVSNFVPGFQDNYGSAFKLQSPTRILRKRPLQTHNVCTSKRRVSLKPKKVVATKDNKNCENFYLARTLKLPKTTSLETIYEEPLAGKDGTIKYSGSAKLRKLNFGSKSKVKKRKAKVRKIFGSKHLKRKRMSVEDFILKLRKISTKAESEEIAELFTNCEIK